jgi:hypothetical protein
MDLYLALLQDRLPIYVRTIVDLGPRAGLGSIQDNLFAVTRATIDFYCEILSAKAAVCARPAQLVRLRQQLRARDLGPAIAYQKVAAYLRKEQELGRLPADVTPVACAHLLLGACVSYAFTDLLMGGDDQPPRDEYARDIVRGLRLGC